MKNKRRYGRRVTIADVLVSLGHLVGRVGVDCAARGQHTFSRTAYCCTF